MGKIFLCIKITFLRLISKYTWNPMILNELGKNVQIHAKKRQF